MNTGDEMPATAISPEPVLRRVEVAAAPRADEVAARPDDIKLATEHVSIQYGEKVAVRDVSLTIQARSIMALIGPSGSGKSTFLRCFNRMNDLIPGASVQGAVCLDGENVMDADVSVVELRRRVGMVFQRPNPLPISVYENVVFGLRIHSERNELRRSSLDQAVEAALTEVGLWEDLKDRLDAKATSLQLEQQQKLCIARLLPLKPRVILMDEPCSALDVEGTRAIEELMFGLKGRYTILIVTHNMAQARRVSQECAFMLLGEMIEHTRTEDLFLTPKDRRTADYIEGRTAFMEKRKPVFRAR